MKYDRKNATNEERFNYLLNFAPSGPLMHGFLVQAVTEYARQVKAAPKGFMGANPMVSEEAWKRCAEDVLANFKYD